MDWVDPLSYLSDAAGADPGSFPMDWLDSGGSDYSTALGTDLFGVGGFSAPDLGASGGAGANWLSPSVLGALGGAAPGAMNLLAQFLGHGQGQSVNPNVPTAQRAIQAQQGQALGYMQPGANQLWNTGTGLMNQLGQGQNPMQQQQQSILAALAPQAANMASGNMQIPPQLQALVKQAYQPYVGDIAQQAIESARNRGFAGGAELLNTGPAGAIAGPALANAAGMEAQSLLQAMLQFPQASANIAGAYNQPINQMAGIAGQSMAPQQAQAQGYGQMFSAYPYGQTQTNTGNMGQAAGQMLAGAAQGYAAPGQQAQQQQQWNSLLNALQGTKQSAGGMSGTMP